MNRRQFSLSLTALLPTLARLAVSVPVEARQQLNESQSNITISAEDLAARLSTDQDAIQVLDASPLRSYRSQHIPQARHAWWQQTIDPNYPVYGAVTTQGDAQAHRTEVLEEFGVPRSSYIVVYDNIWTYRASRIVWYLRFLGYPDVSILDGGLNAWKQIGKSCEAGSGPARRSVDASADPQEGYYLVTRQLIDRLDTSSTTIVDTRTSEERREAFGDPPRIGTIPGSIHLPWTELVQPEDGTLRVPGDIQALLRRSSVNLSDEFVVFARFGVDAALPWLALKSVGISNVLTYDRGWVEWAGRPDLPIDEL